MAFLRRAKQAHRNKQHDSHGKSGNHKAVADPGPKDERRGQTRAEHHNTFEQAHPACRPDAPMRKSNGAHPALYPADDHGTIGAAKSERVGQRDIDLEVTRLIGTVIQITLRVLIEDIDRRG